MLMFQLQLINLLRREDKMLVSNIDKETLAPLHCRQNELFRNFIISYED